MSLISARYDVCSNFIAYITCMCEEHVVLL